jgi:hypothetical protein
MSRAQTDLQSLVGRLRDTAVDLIVKGAFLPIGASISRNGEFVVEYVPPAATSLETRKALHRKLVDIARSGQARAVAICHSLAARTGAFLVVSVDHCEDEPVTILFSIEQENGRDQVGTKPIAQRAAYSFFDFVDVPTAQRMLPGTWVAEREQDDRVTYHPNNGLERKGQAGFWGVEEEDFYTNLVEFAGGSSAPSRVSRIIRVSPERLVLNEVSSGLVTETAYRRVTI